MTRDPAEKSPFLHRDARRALRAQYAPCMGDRMSFERTLELAGLSLLLVQRDTGCFGEIAYAYQVAHAIGLPVEESGDAITTAVFCAVNPGFNGNISFRELGDRAWAQATGQLDE